MSEFMQNDIFTSFVGVSMATVNIQTDLEHSLGNYDILPLSCGMKMHKLRNFKFSENLEAKIASYRLWPFKSQ